MTKRKPAPRRPSESLVKGVSRLTGWGVNRVARNLARLSSEQLTELESANDAGRQSLLWKWADVLEPPRPAKPRNVRKPAGPHPPALGEAEAA